MTLCLSRFTITSYVFKIGTRLITGKSFFFCFVHDCWLLATEFFRSLLLLSEKNYHVTSRTKRPCEFYAVDWRLTFSAFLFPLSVVPVKWLVSFSKTNRFRYTHTYIHTYFTYLLTPYNIASVDGLNMNLLWTAFRIHISSETKDKLDSLGGYHMQYRGEVELKV